MKPDTSMVAFFLRTEPPDGLPVYELNRITWPSEVWSALREEDPLIVAKIDGALDAVTEVRSYDVEVGVMIPLGLSSEDFETWHLAHPEARFNMTFHGIGALAADIPADRLAQLFGVKWRHRFIRNLRWGGAS